MVTQLRFKGVEGMVGLLLASGPRQLQLPQEQRQSPTHPGGIGFELKQGKGSLPMQLQQPLVVMAP